MSTYQLHQFVTKRDDGALTIVLSGEIDLANAPAVTELIAAALESGESRLIVDMSGVSFIDSSGLTALLVGLRATREAGGSLSLRGVTKRTMGLLRVTGLDTVFELET